MNLTGYYREDQSKAMSWCINNGIKIWCDPNIEKKGKYWYQNGTYSIVVDNNGKRTVSPETYTKKEVYTKLWELYCYMYDVNL